MKRYKYKNVNKALKNLVGYLKSIENVWGEMRNLKMYDAFFKAEEILDKYPLVKEECVADRYGRVDPASDLFHWWCDMEYDSFMDWMKEEGIKDQRVYIGRTSSFYLTNIHDCRLDYVVAELIDEVCGGFDYIDIELSGDRIVMSKVGWGSYSEQDILDFAQDEMEYISRGYFLKDVKKFFQDAIKEADYIDSLKKDQVEIFENYISDRNDQLEYDREMEEKRQYQIEMATMACYI